MTNLSSNENSNKNFHNRAAGARQQLIRFEDEPSAPPALFDLLKMILEWATEMIAADAGEIFLWDATAGDLVLSVSNGFLEQYTGTHLKPGEGISGRAFELNESLIVEDYNNWEGKPIAFNEHPPDMDVLAVPMRWQGKIIGVLVVDANVKAKRFSENDILMVSMFANVAAAAIQNERFYRDLEQRSNHLAETLERMVIERTAEIAHRALQLETSARISRDISSLLEIDKLLKRIVNVIRKTFRYDHASIFLYEPAHNLFTRRAGSTRKPFIGCREITSLNEDIIKQCYQAVHAREVKLIQTPLKEGAKPLPETPPGFRLIVPLRHGNRIIGILNIWRQGMEPVSVSDIIMFRSLGDQIAVAIENAMLYRYQQELVVIDERNRIARDLHDAVNQTLFSAMMIAENLPSIYDANREAGKRLLTDLYQLNRSALTEMRSLLVELRPETMQQVGLDLLLAQLADALERRTGIQVETTLQETGEIPSEVKQCFYRIAQESLSNVARHAEASQLSIALRRGKGESLEMLIHDNGKGFQPYQVTSGLGINIMRERANMINAKFDIQCASGQGTRVDLIWKKPGMNSIPVNKRVRTKK